MKQIRYTALALGTLCVLSLSSCVKDLDRVPTNDVTSAKVYSDTKSTYEALAKVYGAWSLSENDVADLDDGFTGFTRAFWNIQELPTDEAKSAWDDAALNGLNEMKWDASTGFVLGLYYRSIIQIKFANEFLVNIDASPIDAGEKELMKAEARFIRAYQYWVLMDVFGNPPFFTEKDATGKTAPKQIQRADLFKYVESELLDILPKLKPARQQVYGRADAGAAEALLARLYLNAEVYTGEPRYKEAAEYAEKVISSGYTLHPEYKHLFYGDNDKFRDEIILSVVADGNNAQSWSGPTFFVASSFNDNVIGALVAQGKIPGIGTNQKWGGNRATPTFAKLFDKAPDDSRALILRSTPDMPKLKEFNQGVHVYKFVNLRTDGSKPLHVDFCDMDFPLFRLAEMHLIYAEASLRDASVDKSKGLRYYNALRTRAGVPTVTSITLRDVLDERGRELYWEGHRRTDLIRYKLLTTADYMWEWKGGAEHGRAVDATRNLYPIPGSDLLANIENLKQNPGY